MIKDVDAFCDGSGIVFKLYVDRRGAFDSLNCIYGHRSILATTGAYDSSTGAVFCNALWLVTVLSLSYNALINQ